MKRPAPAPWTTAGAGAAFLLLPARGATLSRPGEAAANRLTDGVRFGFTHETNGNTNAREIDSR